MMTRTSAPDYVADGIHMNSVGRADHRRPAAIARASRARFSATTSSTAPP
jgi:hypothetical protein